MGNIADTVKKFLLIGMEIELLLGIYEEGNMEEVEKLQKIGEGLLRLKNLHQKEPE